MKYITSRLLPCMTALALSMATTSALSADPVEVAYVIGGGTGTNHSNLWRITDLESGTLVPVAIVNSDLHAIAVDATGYIWAASARYTGNPWLYRIHPVTGKIDFAVQTDLNGTISDMTMMGTTLYARDRSQFRLNTVNTTTGARTAAANTIFNRMAISAGLDGSTLYGVASNRLYTINTTTGAAITTDELVSTPDNVFGQARGGEIAADGYFYVIDGGSGSRQLLRVDLAAKTSELVSGLPATSQSIGIARINDSDGDGIPDIYETAWGLQASSNDAAGDEDGDGVTNLEEFEIGTDPTIADSDNDGLNDGDEMAAGTDPLNSNTDADGMNDSTEVLLGSDPLDGLPAFQTLFTDDSFGDFHTVGAAQDSDGNYHIVASLFDDSEADFVPYYTMLDPDGSVLISLSRIAGTAQLVDIFARTQVLPKPDGTVAILAQTNRSLSYMLIDPSADDQNGDGVDISTNTDFVLRDPTNVLQDSVPLDINSRHPFSFLDGNDLYVIRHDLASGEIILSRFAADGTNLSDVVVFDNGLDDSRNDFSAVLDANGRVHVVMSSDGVTDQEEVYYFAMDLNGDALIQPVRLTDNNGSPSMRPEIVSIGTDRYLVAWADKGYRQPYNSDSSGADIMMATLDVSGEDFAEGTLSADDIMEAPPQVLTKTLPGQYFDLRSDDAGGARLVYGLTRGGKNYAPDLITSIAMTSVAADGSYGLPIMISQFANFGSRGHVSAKFAGDAVVFSDSEFNLMFAKASASSQAPLSSSLNATLSKGSFMYLEDLAVADLNSTQSSALPEGYDFNDGFVQFAIGGIDVGDTVNVTFDVSGVPNGATYFKWDGSAWSAFPFVDLGSNQIQISLTDGGAGDMDGVANGVIVDPSGLGSPTFPVGDAVGVKGGGGGCVIGGKGPFDPTLPLLALLAAGYLVRRRFTVSQ